MGSRLSHTSALTWTLTATSLCALSGCGFGGKPSIEVTSARVVDRTPTALHLEFALEGKNMGDEPLPLRNIEYTLALDGKTVFEGSRLADRTLPAFGTQTLLLPAVLILDEAGQDTSPRYVFSGQIEYSKPGELADVLFDAKIVRPKVSFADRGTLELGEPTGSGAQTPLSMPVGSGEPAAMQTR